MIKVSCPCGGTFEVDGVGAAAANERTERWLVLHQDCVNIRVIEHQMASKKATAMTFDWKAGFRFIDNENVNYDNFQFYPTGNVHCKECNYAQARGEPPQHAADCPLA